MKSTKIRKFNGFEEEFKSSLAERLSENIFNRIHFDIAKSTSTEESSKIAFNLCHFIADELEKTRFEIIKK